MHNFILGLIVGAAIMLAFWWQDANRLHNDLMRLKHDSDRMRLDLNALIEYMEKDKHIS